MREFDENGLEICKFQARLFEKAETIFSGSDAVFVNRFMHSDSARHMGLDGFWSESNDVERILSDLGSRYDLTRGNLKFGSEPMFWMGYLYRYWCYTHQVSSKEVYSVIGAKELSQLYLPYHTLDPGSAIKRIIEAKGNPERPSPLEALKKAYRWN